MSTAGVVLFAVELAQQVLPLAIKGVTSAIQLWNEGNVVIAQMIQEKRDPTAAEWDDLNAKIGALQADLHSDDPDEVGQQGLDGSDAET